ncbi:MAG: formylglycine-generating enzyme family protein [Chloroflexi bacterium]|nr:formylglycine-generating enzyme family protein [Chloroflexota bacterium]MYD38172.1 formylglycine-generating enzyme family protein [Chloroflexota bacterium]
MGYRKLGGRRNRGAAWQWGILGFLPGLVCGLTILLAVIAEGTIPAYFLPTPQPQVVQQIVHVVLTATPEPSPPPLEPTPQVLIITATPLPAAQIQPTNAPISVQVQPTALPTSIPTSSPQPAIPTVNPVPEALLRLRSDTATIPGGSFIMGTNPAEVAAAVRECQNNGGTCLAQYAQDSYPEHEVRVEPFLMEITEVSFTQYVAFLNLLGPNSHETACPGFWCIQTRNDSESAPIVFNGSSYSINTGLAQHPVYGVNWHGARAYCEAAGRRLPTEAEWERAARVEDSRIYPWGNIWDNALANTKWSRETPSHFPVASPEYEFGRSLYGLYHLAGNVAEWVSDYYSETYYQQQAQLGLSVDPTGPINGLEKVLRGGSINSVPFFSRAVHRQSAGESEFRLWVGFRCAEDAPNPEAIGSSDLNPAALGVDVPAAPAIDNAPGNAQPTLPPPPQPANSTG